ncbi:MAG: cupin domain-containing protein [Formosimonas sp.]
MQIKPQEIVRQLTASQPFAEVFRHGGVSVELYRPVGQDLQQPHERDEIYVILSGEGIFNHDGTRQAFQAGDLLWVAAGVEHRFEQFSSDFATWVIFYTTQQEPL